MAAPPTAARWPTLCHGVHFTAIHYFLRLEEAKLQETANYNGHHSKYCIKVPILCKFHLMYYFRAIICLFYILPGGSQTEPKEKLGVEPKNIHYSRLR